jgi:UDP-N-acetyl-D-glucosamine dehydrogenase
VSNQNLLEQRLRDQSATIAVIGLGYVGLPLATACVRAGFSTIGIDVDPDRIATINRGESGLTDLPDETIQQALQTDRLHAQTQYDVLQSCDVAIICVPTPLNKTKDPDLSFVVNALRSVRDFLHQDMLIVLESTTYPGFTREVALPLLEESGLSCGEEFCLAFSPERTDPGNAEYGVVNTTKIVGGSSELCTRIARVLYEEIIESVYTVSSTDCAEMVKLLENTFRAVNIGLVNEVALMCHHLNIDTWEVIEGAKTKPFGFMPFYPGPGLGGHCIPVDPLYLSWKLRSHNYTARFIELAQAINASMPLHVVQLIGDALNAHEKAIRGARITLFGVTYKKNVGDTRESPAIEILGLLASKGALVGFCDPFVDRIEVGGVVYEQTPMEDALGNMDAAVITTDHDAFSLAQVVEGAPLIVDTRNATTALNLSEQQAAKVWRL